jgi:hypothetical protein
MTEFYEMRHEVEAGHIVSFTGFRGWMRRTMNQAVPLWLAVLFLAFCIFAARSVVMVGGIRG